MASLSGVQPLRIFEWGCPLNSERSGTPWLQNRPHCTPNPLMPDAMPGAKTRRVADRVGRREFGLLSAAVHHRERPNVGPDSVTL